MARLKPLLLLALGVAGLDQLTKGFILRSLAVGSGFGLIPGYVDIVHVRNRGAAFGLFAGQSSTWTVPFFYIATAVSLVLLLLYYYSLKEVERSQRTALSFMCGGALGNLVDRIVHGNVVDFVSLHIRDRWADFWLAGRHITFKLEWPAFNVADSAITLSVIWLFLATLRRLPGPAPKGGGS